MLAVDEIGCHFLSLAVRAGSPVSAKAWQRQPPQSISRRSQERQGSAIHAVPRNRAKAAEWYQISARLASPTVGKRNPGRLSAAWHGSTLPDGVMLKKRRPQPPMQAFGRCA